MPNSDKHLSDRLIGLRQSEILVQCDPLRSDDDGQAQAPSAQRREGGPENPRSNQAPYVDSFVRCAPLVIPTVVIIEVVRFV